MTHSEKFLPEEGQKYIINGQIANLDRFDTSVNWMQWTVLSGNSTERLSGHISNTTIEPLESDGTQRFHYADLDLAMATVHGIPDPQPEPGNTDRVKAPIGGSVGQQSTDQITTTESFSTPSQKPARAKASAEVANADTASA